MRRDAPGGGPGKGKEKETGTRTGGGVFGEQSPMTSDASTSLAASSFSRVTSHLAPSSLPISSSRCSTTALVPLSTRAAAASTPLHAPMLLAMLSPSANHPTSLPRARPTRWMNLRAVTSGRQEPATILVEPDPSPTPSSILLFPLRPPSDFRRFSSSLVTTPAGTGTDHSNRLCASSPRETEFECRKGQREVFAGSEEARAMNKEKPAKATTGLPVKVQSPAGRKGTGATSTATSGASHGFYAGAPGAYKWIDQFFHNPTFVANPWADVMQSSPFPSIHALEIPAALALLHLASCNEVHRYALCDGTQQCFPMHTPHACLSPLVVACSPTGPQPRSANGAAMRALFIWRA